MPDTNTSPAAVIEPTAERQQTVNELYVRNASYIHELCDADPTLSFDTSGKIADALANYIANYDGPLTDEGFQRWIASIILPALSFAAIYRDCAEHIRASIRKVFATCLDLGVTQDTYNEAEQRTWLWAWEHLKSLRAPNQRAKPTTRLYAAAKFQALSVRKALLRTKERFRDISLSRIGTDTNVYECTGAIIEPLPPKEEREQFNPFERCETVEKAA